MYALKVSGGALDESIHQVEYALFLMSALSHVFKEDYFVKDK